MNRFLKVFAIALCLQCPIVSYSANGHNFSDVDEKELPYGLFITKDSTLSIEAVLKSDDLFLNFDSDQKTRPNQTYWIRLDFKNDMSAINTSPLWFLKFNSFDYATLFYQKNGSLATKPIGKYDLETFGNSIKSDKYFSEISFAPNALVEGQYLYIKAQRAMYFEQLSNWKFSFQTGSLKDRYKWNDLKKYLPTYLFMGGCIIMCLLTLLLFLYLGRWEFLFNCLYVLSLLFYIGKDELLLFFDFGTDNVLLKDWVMEDIAITTGLFYQGFVVFYLNLRKDYIFSYRVIQVSFSLHILMILVDVFFYQFGYYISHIYLLEALNIIDAITGFLVITNLIYYNKNVITRFFIVGSTIFMIGVVHYFFTQDASDPLRHYNKLFVTVACSLEILVFSIGLGYKVYAEIIEKFRLQKEALLYKSKALRAQMNPHFIFNALGSIQYLIINKKNTTALNYLGKFSRLSRNVLESSFETMAILDDEVKMLEDYLELESLRFDNAFSYTIDVDEKLDSEEIEIPFMITQPFVENAIVHGLLPKEKGIKELKILFREAPGFLVCQIDDTGVGRKKAVEIKTDYQHAKKSRGLDVTRDRLESLPNGKGRLLIVNKIDEKGKPSGTKVTLHIPLMVP